MKNIEQSVKMMIAGVIGLMLGIGGQAAAKPLKVYILAGQSNMQGKGSVELGRDPNNFNNSVRGTSNLPRKARQTFNLLRWISRYTLK